MENKAESQKNILFKDLIRQISNDLLESQTEREGSEQPPIFEVESLVLEVNFIVEKEETAGAAFQLSILTAGAEIKSKDAQIHKITLTLKKGSNMTVLPFVVKATS